VDAGPGEFGGGVINLTTLAIPTHPFLDVSVGISGDAETTGQMGYDYYGNKYDWTGYGNRDIPPALADFFASGERLSAGNVDSAAIASQLVGRNNGIVQKIEEIPPNYSASITGGNTWLIGDSELVVKQVRGEYRVKDAGLKPLHAEVRSALSGFASWEIRHVRREHNKRADELVNEALDAAG